MTKALSPELQWVRLRSSPICRGHGQVRHRQLIWEFDARPTPLSRCYRLQIRLKHQGRPKVTVVSPNLTQLAEGRTLPHVYHTIPMRLCLYLPGADEWTSDKSIAETIVPWAYLWLMYFEHWLTTDEWLGGGKHPGEDNNGEE